MFYLSFTVIINQKLAIDSQKIKREIRAYHYEKSTRKGRQQERKKGTRELQNNQKTMNKMALISPYLK